MKCQKCQFVNPQGVKFCGECGAKLERICPECQSSNPPQFKFCGECGHDLSKAREAPPIDYAKPQSYTPRFLADKILTMRSAIEGERKLVTVLFADVANYTAMAEGLDPEEVHQIMDGCFKILLAEIHRYEGTINQFTGDGVMALFGAPVAHEDHAQRGCYAALSAQKAIEDYGKRVMKDYRTEFEMRMGLNTGPVIVGSIGDDLRMDYTAVGDTTNLASRMESMAKPGTILVSGHTYKLAKDFFEFEFLGRAQVKGKKRLQEAYELIGASEVKTRIAASVARGLTKFVGRQREIGALNEGFEKARSGLGQVIGIVGEAGVGKSRLILEFKNQLPGDEHTYFEGRCLHYGCSMAYLPILDILKSYFQIGEEEQEDAVKQKIKNKTLQLDANLEHTLPPFQDLFSLEVDDEAYLELEPKRKKEKTFEALRDLFVCESQRRPLVLVIEDIHWIDKTSEELLDYLIGRLSNTSILLILLYRPEYTHLWGSKSYYSRIGVDQLSTRTSSDLVHSIFEGAEVVPELREFILGRTTGNPLFMEELTHTLLEDGSIQRRNNQYVLSREASDIQIPDTIQGIIAARMDRLEQSLKSIMQVASVIGREFAFRILNTITGMKEELKSNLINLQGLEFIYEKRLFPELEYVFKHALTQEVAYSSLLLKRRKEIHEKIGKTVEQIYPERLEELYEVLAYHYSKSENLEKALQYLKLSGDKATRNYSLQESFHFYKEAISTLEKLPETLDNKKGQIEVRRLMASSMIPLGFPKDSLQILQDGERIAKEIGDSKSLAIFYSRMGHYFTVKGGNPLLGVAYSEKCFQEAQKIKDVEILAPVACDLSIAYHTVGAYLKTVEIAPIVIGVLEETKNESEFFGRGYNVYSVL